MEQRGGILESRCLLQIRYRDQMREWYSKHLDSLTKAKA